jgi:integrase
MFSVQIPYGKWEVEMARGEIKSTKVRDGKFDTATARQKLPARREPYFRAIEPGFALGYRRIAGKGGTWIARRYGRDTDQRMTYRALGAADDYAPADGQDVLTFAQAQSAARRWLAELASAAAGGVDPSKPYTVGDALNDYLSHYVTEGGRAEVATRRAVNVLIRPFLATVPLTKLTHARVKGFRDGLAETGRRFRAKKGAAHKIEKLNPKDGEQLRKRRATANRVFSFLRAALNVALQNRKIATDAAWSGVKPFKNVDLPKVRYLVDAEAVRLVNACAGDMRALVTAALLTGCRYGELVRMRAADFDADTGMLHVPVTKNGKPRHIVMADEGREFLTQSTAGKAAGAIVFLRDNGHPWKPTDQARPLKAACQAAKITPAVSFHILRHTYASRLARAGAPMAVIAAQLGHTDLRMTSRHYAHLSPGYVADTVRAAFGSMGIVDMKSAKVVPISAG